MTDWSYDAWPSGHPYDWSPASRNEHPDDNIDFHVDLGCGRIKKARIGIDRSPADGVDLVMNLDDPAIQLPFADSSIHSIVSHHAMEHIEHFIPLMDECYRVLMPGAPMRIIVPLFPSASAVADPDHRRYFMQETFAAFCGTPGDSPQDCWLASFSVPYTKARFTQTHIDWTPDPGPAEVWESAREVRVTLRAEK